MAFAEPFLPEKQVNCIKAWCCIKSLVQRSLWSAIVEESKTKIRQGSRVHALKVKWGWPHNADNLSFQVNTLQARPKSFIHKNTLSALGSDGKLTPMSDTTLDKRCDGLVETDREPSKTANQIHRDEAPPDGGWGWIVCLGALMVNFLTVGQQNSAGVVYSALLKEHSSQRGETGNFCFFIC